MTDWTVPTPRREALAVWYRNILLWKKMAIGSALTQFGEPFIYLLGLGYGLGMFIGEMAAGRKRKLPSKSRSQLMLPSQHYFVCQCYLVATMGRFTCYMGGMITSMI